MLIQLKNKESDIVNKSKQKNFFFRKQAALLLIGALMAGLLPMGTGMKSWATEQPTLRNPRILKTTQEVAPGSVRKELKNPTTENGITTWDCIWFGNYWQEDINGDGKADKNDEKTPIKWRVLSVEGDDVFLLADKNLDVQRYNDTDTDVTWETCTMRSWLNGYGAEINKDGKDYSNNNFLNNAFSLDEQSAIKPTNVVNNDNPEYGTEGGNDTSDKVYLLSIDEVTNLEYGFDSSEDYTNIRQAVNTAYTAVGGEIGNSGMSWFGSTEGRWWLRSPGDYSNNASVVYGDGGIASSGDYVYDSYDGVRPALHLNLSSIPNWSYAGTVPSDDVSEWDCIWFGNYWQEDTNGDGKADKNDEKTPIKWRVLSVEGDDVFLLADKNLDVQRYNDTDTDVTWETCTMRSWLNGYRAEMNKDGKDYSNNNFLNNAFSLDEQSAIKPTNVVNNDNPEYGTEGGNDTSDKVYLLSIDEVTNLEYGFDSSRDYYAENRTALNTIFVKWRGAWTSQSEEYEGNGYWWLRSPGYNSNLASSVDFSGLDDMFGRSVDDFLIVVRPALHLNLSSASGCQYAGIVNSDGKVEEIEAPAPSVIPSPIEPGNTQKPQETIVPETSSQPGDPSVVPSTQQPDPSATPDPGITSGSGKAAVGKVLALKLKQKKGIVTASWKKTIGVKGYQICYSTSKKWKNKKQKLIKKNKAVIKNLKKKKTYYFRVRAYRLEGTKKVYGAWSGVKKIKIKK